MTTIHTISVGNIKAMWNNWTIALSAPIALLIASYFVPKLWLPLVAFTFAYILSSRLRYESGRQTIKGCNLIVWVMTWTMLWTAVIMCVINIIYAKWFVTGVYQIDPINPKHPFITPLIVFPTAFIVCLYFIARRRKSSHCRRCLSRFGYYDNGNKPIALLYFNESKYQIKYIASLSVAISVIDWFYYYKFYINVNLNSPDRFFFIFLPIVLMVMALIYMTVRYMNMADNISAKTSTPKQQLMTMVRYLMFSNDTVCLSTDPDGYLDTPAKTLEPRHEKLTAEQATESFAKIAGMNNFTTKYLYTDSGYSGGPNVFHYAVFINPADVANLHIDGAWSTIDQLDRQLKAGNLSPELLSEIHRIYSVTMAWKTYDRQGKRLYPIKNYQPTFRLRDLCKWNVDYDDRSWLDIAANNQDRPFFKLRRFWRRNFRH